MQLMGPAPPWIVGRLIPSGAEPVRQPVACHKGHQETASAGWFGQL
jgi:hypothetical protein